MDPRQQASGRGTVRPSERPTATPTPTGTPTSPGSKKWLWVGLAVAVVLFLGVGAVVRHTVFAGPKPASDRYQAVFLDNGQVFFGKLKNTTGTYLTLENAYYTTKTSTSEGDDKKTDSSNVSISKVGNEVYGPDDTVQVRAEQVLFWQNLKADSKVAEVIDNDQ